MEQVATIKFGGTLSAKDIGLLVLVMFLWALCYPLITFSLNTAPPLFFAAIRSFIAGVTLLAFASGVKAAMPKGRSNWIKVSIIGLGTATLGLGGMFKSGGVVSPGIATVISNIQPILAAFLVYVVLGERLEHRLLKSLLLGLIGILCIAIPGFSQADANTTPSGILFVLLAATGVAVGNVVFHSLPKHLNVLMVSAWQFLLGSAPLIFISWIYEPIADFTWSLRFLISLFTLAILGTAVPIVIWFSILQRIPLNQANIFTFLTPAIALVLGGVFFNERLLWFEVMGILFILGGALFAINFKPS